MGLSTANYLVHLHIHTVEDLLFHLPLRYQDRTRTVPIGSLKPGDQALIEGIIQHTDIQYRGRRTLLCRIQDNTGDIMLRFFHFHPSQQRGLSSSGLLLRCFGTVRSNYRNALEMVHPEYRFGKTVHELPLEECLTPIYPSTQGLTQSTLRKLTHQALQLLDSHAVLSELLPTALLHALQLPSLADAIIYVHRPPPKAPVDLLQNGQHPCQQRLILEELIAHHLGLRRRRQHMKRQSARVLIDISPASKNVLQQQLERSLPFALTHAQQRVITEINHDLTQPHPMLRLVQGDVGSGKTIIAMMAALAAVEKGYQAAVMAPTELLAEQHWRTFQQGLQPLGITVGWLAGSLTGRARKAMLNSIQSGTCHIIVGTHALFQTDVVFCHLALIVIDEQHRFGVNQRLALKAKGYLLGDYPHQLIMTATPIPRTLAMTAYADLDVSVIDELPPGRRPIHTLVLPSERRSDVIERIRQRCQTHQQAYWVCTLIEDSEVMQCEAAEITYQKLQTALPQLRLGLVHGRLKTAQKEAVMAAFKQGAIDLLVATTVIEVGVDVANASFMVIENPERLGLAQLHQLRGRIGRSHQESHCILLYQKPLSRMASQRLAILRRTTDGFVIAQEDLLLRGPGDVLGVQQAGLLQLRIADILRDHHLLPRVRQMSDRLLREYPQQAELLIRRWLKDTEKYWDV